MPEDNAVAPASQPGTEGASAPVTDPSQTQKSDTDPQTDNSAEKADGADPESSSETEGEPDQKSLSRTQVRFQSLVGKLHEKDEEITRLKSLQGDPEKLTDDEKETLGQFKKLGIPTVGDLLKNQESLQKEAKEEFDTLLSECEERYSGFNRKEVLEYGEKNRIFNPMAAFKALQYDKSQIAKIKKAAPKIEKTSGGTAAAPAVKTATPLKFEDGSLQKSMEEKLKTQMAAA